MRWSAHVETFILWMQLPVREEVSGCWANLYKTCLYKKHVIKVRCGN
jgi:hypothetical protein